MLVTKIAPKLKPYVLAAGLAVGTMSAAAAPMMRDSFEKVDNKEIAAEQTDKNEKEDRIIWLDLIQWIPLVGFWGTLKLADYIEKKEQAEEQKEAEGKNKEV